MFSSLSTVKYKPWFHTLSTHTSHSFLQLSESATIKGFCHKKLLCESYHHSPLMPLPVNLLSSIHWKQTPQWEHWYCEWTEFPVSSDCLLSNQETPTISLFTDSPPSETSMLLFLTAIKSQNKSSWICPLFYFIPISPLLYKTAWKNYFYAHHCQFLSSNLCWILLGQVISWLDYHYNICNVFFIVCLFSSNLLIPLFYYFIFWQCLIM